jgi:hypothetical protein
VTRWRDDGVRRAMLAPGLRQSRGLHQMPEHACRCSRLGPMRSHGAGPRRWAIRQPDESRLCRSPGPPAKASPALLRWLTARIRGHGAVLVPLSNWPEADLHLELVGSVWLGLEGMSGCRRARPW